MGTSDDVADRARKIKDLASKISGDLRNPSEANIEHAKECAADIHELADQIEDAVRDAD